jgi:hypothetical protein
MWTPEAAMKVTGIQLSSVGGKYIRARSWAVASEMLYRHGTKSSGDSTGG